MGPRKVTLTALMTVYYCVPVNTKRKTGAEVLTVSIVRQEISETATYTGRIRTEVETRHPFRITGWMIERSANVGARVAPGQVVAKLEPQNELNALRFAQADIAAAEYFS